MPSRARSRWLGLIRLGVHLACLVPFALLLWDGAHSHLTVNPIQAITVRTGDTTLRLLLITLVVTPLNALLGWSWTVPLRRPLGLYAFFYAALHFLTFTVLDNGVLLNYVLSVYAGGRGRYPPLVDWVALQDAVLQKPYALVGLSAFALLLPLALTSTRGWMRRLGRRWRGLHRLVYAAAALGVVHYYLSVKADVRQPLLYGAALAVLLVLRMPAVRRPLARRLRVRRRSSPASAR